MIPLSKVISGGQTGVDRAARRAARAAGIPTGGWAPRGWQTEDGPAPWLGSDDWGLKEWSAPGYAARTRRNVEDADATLILTDRHPLTGGTRLTFEHAHFVGRRGMGLY